MLESSFLTVMSLQIVLYNIVEFIADRMNACDNWVVADVGKSAFVQGSDAFLVLASVSFLKPEPLRSREIFPGNRPDIRGHHEAVIPV